MSAPNGITPFPSIPTQNQADATLAVAALAASQPSKPVASPVSLPHKEAVPIYHAEVAPVIPETTKLVEVRESEPLPAEVEGWLQKLDQEGDIRLDQPLTHDGEVLLSDTEAQVVKQKIILPMTQTSAQQGLTQKVTESARWLAEWCVRLIKIMKDRVKYAPEPIKSN